MRASLEELLVGEGPADGEAEPGSGGLDPYRGVVESLAEEYDVLDVAAAAVRLADEAEDGATSEDAEHIPDAAVPRRDERQERSRRDVRHRIAGGAHPARRQRADRDRSDRGRGGGDLTRLYLSVGRKAGVRPGDLVGAIANEAGIDSREIGAIEITDRFSLVEVPDAAADQVIHALRATTIRGKRVTARRDREAE
jgi:ATP-dependent RNA helicase DeaD